MIEHIRIVGKPLGLIRGALPRATRTQAETKEEAARLNREARRQRADKNAEDAARLRAARAPVAVKAPKAKPTPAARFTPAAVYEARRRASEPSSGAPAAPTPPRTLGQLARDYYGGAGIGGELIGSSARGGVR